MTANLVPIIIDKMVESDYAHYQLGGQIYVCPLNVIDKYPESRLADYIRKRNKNKESQQEPILIEPNSIHNGMINHFGDILLYMRDTKSLDLKDWTKSNMEKLLEEATFFNIPGIIERCEVAISEKNNRLQQAQATPVSIETYQVVSVRDLPAHLGAVEKLTYVFSCDLTSKIKTLLGLLDPFYMDICCFNGPYPGPVKYIGLIYDPKKPSIICGTRSTDPTHHYAMVISAQKISRLGSNYYYKIPEFCKLYGVPLA